MNILPNMNPDDLHEVILCATLYSINRSTHARIHMAEILYRNAACLPPETITILIRGIEEEIELGIENQNELRAWEHTLDILKKEKK